MSKEFIRVKNFEQLGLGLFVHWGLYSQLAKGEWSEKIHKTPREKYEKLIDTFTAEKFSAKTLVTQAKQMGAKYITLTTKHHEGFFLYDTKGLSEFDALHAPANRDLVREFIDECHRQEIQPFLYMATYDWHMESFEKDFPSFLEYLRKSVEILCTNYGKIGGFWFDGNWSKEDADWQLDALYGTIREHQPDCIIINNTGLDNRGAIVHPEVDSVTFEKGTPETIRKVEGTQKHLAGEICTTMNYHWGIAKKDLDYKSLPQILEEMCYARRVGMNFLLNVGPDGQGEIPLLCREYMRHIGIWLETFGEAFYTTQPSVIYTKSNAKDFALESDKEIYFFLHDLSVVGDENVVLRGDAVNPRSFIQAKEAIHDLHWLDNGERLTFTQDTTKGLLTLDATGYHYGENWVIRVAKALKS